MPLLSRVKTWVTEVLTASDLNAEFDNIINNGLKSDKIEGISADVSAMRVTTDPGELGTESLASSVEGELKRLRNMVKEISGQAQWYISPTRALNDLSPSPIVTAEITDLNVTTAKLAADAVDGSKIGDDVIDSEHYVAGSIDNEHLANDSVANANIVNGAITDAKVNDVDVSKISNIGIYGAASGSTSAAVNLVTLSPLQVNGNILVILTPGLLATQSFSGGGGGGSILVDISRNGSVIFTRTILNGENIKEAIAVLDTGASGSTTYSVTTRSRVSPFVLTYNFQMQAFHVS